MTFRSVRSTSCLPPKRERWIGAVLQLLPTCHIPGYGYYTHIVCQDNMKKPQVPCADPDEINISATFNEAKAI